MAALAHFLPVFGDLEEQVQVKAGVVTAFLGSAATIISTAGWELPKASGADAVSTMDTPASAALR